MRILVELEELFSEMDCYINTVEIQCCFAGVKWENGKFFPLMYRVG